jgi:hypothetical protein
VSGSVHVRCIRLYTWRRKRLRCDRRKADPAASKHRQLLLLLCVRFSIFFPTAPASLGAHKRDEEEGPVVKKLNVHPSHSLHSLISDAIQ